MRRRPPAVSEGFLDRAALQCLIDEDDLNTKMLKFINNHDIIISVPGQAVRRMKALQVGLAASPLPPGLAIDPGPDGATVQVALLIDETEGTLQDQIVLTDPRPRASTWLASAGPNSPFARGADIDCGPNWLRVIHAVFPPFTLRRLRQEVIARGSPPRSAWLMIFAMTPLERRGRMPRPSTSHLDVKTQILDSESVEGVVLRSKLPCLKPPCKGVMRPCRTNQASRCRASPFLLRPRFARRMSDSYICPGNFVTLWEASSRSRWRPDQHSRLWPNTLSTTRCANLVLRAEEWRWSSLWQRCHPTGEERSLLAAWPIDTPANWLERVNQTDDAQELEALCRSVERSRPFGQPEWTRKSRNVWA